jgi:hypothetical protein
MIVVITERISATGLLFDWSDWKLERSMKIKWDEVNHVQIVGFCDLLLMFEVLAQNSHVPV